MAKFKDSPSSRIFSTEDFDEFCLEVFRYQYLNNPTYREFCDSLGRDIRSVSEKADIPFLPIEFFKHRTITCPAGVDPDLLFESSGTTHTGQSRHYVLDQDIYKASIEKGFRRFYGDPAEYNFLALLPSYLERNNSSLVFMFRHLMSLSQDNTHGFYLQDFDKLLQDIETVLSGNGRIFLIGVSFALLDLAQSHPVDLSGHILMETGGMKGRREELTREEMHEILSGAFCVRKVHSEYGMTELLSQGWSLGDGIFECPPWMQVLTRDPYDPLQVESAGGRGALNVIDLANIHSCSFIATQDQGEVFEDSSFQVSGRVDNSDVRGCNLLYPSL